MQKFKMPSFSKAFAAANRCRTKSAFDGRASALNSLTRSHFQVQPSVCQSGSVAASLPVVTETESSQLPESTESLNFSGDPQLKPTGKRSSSWQATSLWHNPAEWSDEPEYPALVPRKGTHQYTQYDRLQKSLKVAALPTVREKRHFFVKLFPFLPSQDKLPWRTKTVLFKTGNKTSRAWEQKHMEVWEVPCRSTNYNALPFIKHLTRTALVDRHVGGHFESYYSSNIADEAVVTRIMSIIEPQLEPTILLSLQETLTLREPIDPSPGVQRPERYPWREDAMRTIDNIMRLIQTAVGREKTLDYVNRAQLHKNARIAAYTWRSALHDFDSEQMELEQQGVATTDKIEIWEPHPPWKEPLELEPTEHCFQLRGSAYRVLRHATPLQPIVSRDSTDSTSPMPTEDKFTVYPPGAGYNLLTSTYDENTDPVMQWFDASNVGNANPFASLLINPYSAEYEDLIHDDLRNGEDIYEAMCADMIATCFTQCTAQAHHLGFTFLNELQYPMVVQYVLTDGHEWIFGLYQCNTHAVWQRDEFYGKYRNLAWISPPMRLYESVERHPTTNAVVKIKNINMKVVEQLVRMVIAKPQSMSVEEREQLRPFAHDDGDYKWTTTLEEIAQQRKPVESVHYIVSEAFAVTKSVPTVGTAKVADSKDVQSVVGYVYRTPAGVKKKQRHHRHNGYMAQKYAYLSK